MNLFSLFATLTLDDSQYTKSVENIKKSASDMKSDIMEVAQTYKSESAVMSDVMEQAYEDINQSQQETTNTAKTESEKVKEYWTGAAFDISKGWDLLKTGFKTAVAGITAVTGALLAAEAATEEYRIAMGKLNTAYEAAGYSAETAYQAYSDFYAILGDTDTATEASQLLAKLAQSEEDVAKWTEIAAGVNGTFGDSLPIEGLIESANETAKVGQVTGVLADALNWAGISEDEFNTKLEAAGSESERNKLIMDTLSDTYDEAADAFYKNNEQIIKNRENQQKLTEVMADVGDAVSRVKNAFIDEFMPAITDVGEKVAEFLEQIDAEEIIATVIEKITEIKDLFIAWSPVIAGLTTSILTFRTAMTISALIDNATKAMTAFKTAQNAATVAQAALNYVMSINPFVLVATLIAGVTAALVTLWVTNEDFRNAVIEIWNDVTSAVTDFSDSVVEFFTETVPEAVEQFSQFWEDTVNSIKDTFSNAWNSIIEFFNQTVPAWINSAIEWFNQLPYNLGYALGQAIAAVINFGTNFSNWTENELPVIIDGVIAWFSTLPERIAEWLENVILKIIEWGEELYLKAVEYVSQTIDEIVRWFSMLPEKIWTWLTDTINKVISWGSNLISQGISIARNFVDSVVEIVSELPGKMLDIGVQMVQNLWDGINSMIGWIGDKIGDFVDGIIDGITSGLESGIDSGSSRSYDGSHRSGLNYVPFDGYVAQLHQGEMVLTKEQASNYRNGGVTVIQNIYSEAKTAADLMREARYEQERAVMMGV